MVVAEEVAESEMPSPKAPLVQPQTADHPAGKRGPKFASPARPKSYYCTLYSYCSFIDIYRVFIKYCVFFQEFSKVCRLSLASTRLLLVVQKIISQ